MKLIGNLAHDVNTIKESYKTMHRTGWTVEQFLKLESYLLTTEQREYIQKVFLIAWPEKFEKQGVLF